MTQSRYTEIAITYEGKDISQDLAPSLISFTFTDNHGDKSDDISLTLEDRKGIWLNDWTPSKGDKIKASIILHEDNKAQSLPCGNYEVDEISYSFPPKVISIKAVSVAVSKSARNEKHSKAWEGVTLAAIAGNIAGASGLSLFYDVPLNPFFERKDQTNISDLEFLKNLCRDFGYTVKVAEGKLIIFDEETYETKAPIATLNIDDPKLISAKFTAKTAGIYKSAKLQYHHQHKDETFTGNASDSSVEGTERTLEINERVESSGEANTIAAKRLYDANKGEVKGIIILMGDIRFLAGTTIQLEGFGNFSGKYFIESATHSVTGGYTTTLNIHQGKESKGKSKGAKTKRQSKTTSKKAKTTRILNDGIDHEGRYRGYGEND